jgi:phosphohistidine phosphatase SixA
MPLKCDVITMPLVRQIRRISLVAMIVTCAALAARHDPATAQQHDHGSSAKHGPQHHSHGYDRELALVEKLQAGGLLIFFRHGLTETERAEDERPVDFANCASQRQLSEAGRAVSREIGRHLAALKIPIGEVRASPFCRTRETAELMFGRALTEPRLRGDDREGGRSVEQSLTDLREVAALPAGPGRNQVLVAHFNQPKEGFRTHLDEGDALIFEVSGSELRALGTIPASRWGDMIREGERKRRHKKH